MMYYICQICHAEYIPRSTVQKYCSATCVAEANRRLMKARTEANLDYKHQRNEKRRKAVKETPCECCGIRPVAPGFRKLCDLCFAWDGPDWMHNAEGTRVIV